MKLKTQEFKDTCTIIKNAIDNKNISLYSETLELDASGVTLSMNVTNREYYVSTKFELDEETVFKAAVNAQLFLSLISKMTSEFIDITLDGMSLKVKGNGTYKLPIIFNGDTMVELPKIEISNVTNTMSIPLESLQSIAQYNSKEFQRGTVVQDVQNYYYLDEKGCLTFTQGACVNTFASELESPVKILLSDRLVKLFKLFKDSNTISFTIGMDALPDGMIQTKVNFATPKVCISAIIADPGLVANVPTTAIRGTASKTYPYSIVVNREELLQTLNRLMLFNTDKNYGRFEFSNSKVLIKDWSSENSEELVYVNDCPTLQAYSAIINLNNLSLMLNGYTDEYITICFGDSKAFVIKKQLVSDILPELKVTN